MPETSFDAPPITSRRTGPLGRFRAIPGAAWLVWFAFVVSRPASPSWAGWVGVALALSATVLLTAQDSWRAAFFGFGIGAGTSLGVSKTHLWVLQDQAPGILDILLVFLLVFLAVAVLSVRLKAYLGAVVAQAERTEREEESEHLLRLARSLLETGLTIDGSNAWPTDAETTILRMDALIHDAIPSAVATMQTVGGAGRLDWHPSLADPAWRDLEGILLAYGSEPRLARRTVRIPGGFLCLAPLSDTTGARVLAMRFEEPDAESAQGLLRSFPWHRRTLERDMRTRSQERLRTAEFVADLVSVVLPRMLARQDSMMSEVRHRSEALETALLSSVSHELRTPLSVIRLSATALARPEIWDDAQDRSELLSSLEESTRRLDQLVDNLLTQSRIQAGVLRLVRHRYPVPDVVTAAFQYLGQREDRELPRVTLPPDLPVVLCDLELIKIALANVITNAWVHTPPGTRVDLYAVHARHLPEVAITVADRGPGVPTKDLPRMFDAFYRVSPADGKKRPGTGIGLSIAKTLVGANGGRMWAERRAGGGLMVVLTLPVASQDV